MSAKVWWELTEFGDAGILLPIALVIALWLLLAPATRRSGWLWLAAVLVTAASVALSKLLYMGWRLHPPLVEGLGNTYPRIAAQVAASKSK